MNLSQDLDWKQISVQTWRTKRQVAYANNTLYSHRLTEVQRPKRQQTKPSTMSEKKLLVVVGATGTQGSSVITHFLKEEPEYRLRGLTRNTTSPKAQALAAKGIEMVQANLNDPPSITSAFEGARYLRIHGPRLLPRGRVPRNLRLPSPHRSRRRRDRSPAGEDNRRCCCEGPDAAALGLECDAVCEATKSWQLQGDL